MRDDERLLTADTVIVGDGGVLRPGAVHVRGRRILGVAHPSAFGALDGVEVVAHRRATLLPGLIDTHAHLTFPGDGTPYQGREFQRRPVATLIDTAEHNARVHLEAGVTTIRDNGAPGDAAFAVRDRLSSVGGLPRLLVSGPPVTPTAGHLHWCGGVADGVDGVRSAVGRLADRGVDHIKVMASGGGTPGTWQWEPSYEAEVLAALVDEAHCRGLLVAAHCHAATAIERAVRAGIDSIEHASFLVPPTPGTEPRRVGAAWTGLAAEFSPVVAELIRSQGTHVGATLQGGVGLRDRLRRLESQGRLHRDDVPQREAAERHVARKVAIVSAMVGAGLKDLVMISSDAGPQDTAFGQLLLAMEAGLEAGLSRHDVIQAVTRIASDGVGLSGEIGTLEPGKVADVLAVTGDPLRDLRALHAVEAVYLGGSRVVPASDPAAPRPASRSGVGPPSSSPVTHGQTP